MTNKRSTEIAEIKIDTNGKNGTINTLVKIVLLLVVFITGGSGGYFMRGDGYARKIQENNTSMIAEVTSINHQLTAINTAIGKLQQQAESDGKAVTRLEECQVNMDKRVTRLEDRK